MRNASFFVNIGSLFVLYFTDDNDIYIWKETPF